MKKTLLLVVVLLLAVGTNAQVIFSGEAPASIQGTYDMSYAEAADGWGVADLEDPANYVLDTLVQFFDATAADSLGCSAAANAGDVDGQIAILFRGDCEFGTKAFNAQQAGAVACVIINNQPGTIGMLGGTDGPNVTIPTVMIGLNSGQTLLAEMANEDVEVFIGNKIGFYANDVGTRPSRILRSEQAVTPSLLAQDGSEFNFNVGAWVYNYGSQDQTNVSVNAVVEFNGQPVYSESATPVDIVSTDSAFFSLPDFSLTNYNEGTYTLTYEILSDATDEAPFDNEISSQFSIVSNQFGYSNIDESTLLPVSSGGYRPIDGQTQEPVDEYYSCLHFQDPNASRIAPESMTFSASSAADAQNPSLEGQQMFISVTRLNDNFTDIEDPNYSNPPTNFDLDWVSTEYIFPSDLQNEMVTAEFEEPFALEDNQRYLFCVVSYNPDTYIGHDLDMDYTLNFNNYLQPLFPIYADASWNLNGFGADAVPAIAVNFVDADLLNIENEQLSIKMNAYPSPVSEVLNINFEGYDVDHLELVNLTGQVVANQTVQTGAESTKVDVNDLENGVYIVNVYLTNGMTETMQVVVSH